MSDRDLLNYLHLAEVSANKNQPFGRDRLLVLAGAAACECGLLEIAARCRALIVAGNSRHMIGRFESFPQALRDDEFQPLINHLRQLCPPEQAEFLAENRNPPSGEDETESRAAVLLAGMESRDDSSPG